MLDKKLAIYTDGGCAGNPGVGGWSFVAVAIEKDALIHQASGKELATTNNRMELTAVIEALAWLTASGAATEQTALFTDSQYVKNGISVWIKKWVTNSWKTSNKQAVKNRDLWEKLYLYNQRMRIDWNWLRGHVGHRYNELCHSLIAQLIHR